MLGPYYEWDPAKAAANVRKHRVSFDEAIEALEDLYAIEEDDDSDPSEDRTRTIGRSRTQLLFVVTTERGPDITRIISARRASPHEQADYQRQTLP